LSLPRERLGELMLAERIDLVWFKQQSTSSIKIDHACMRTAALSRMGSVIASLKNADAGVCLK